MSFITAAAVAGIGLSAYSAYSGMNAAKDQAGAQKEQIAAEQRAEQLRRRQMELEARRRSLETVRNQQKARAMALAASNNQGASAGSGLQGGYGQISGDANTQLLATAQNLGIGRGLFDANMSNSYARMSYADASTDAATARGIGQFGSTLLSSADAMGRISGGVNASSGPSGGYYWGGGDNMTYVSVFGRPR